MATYTAIPFFYPTGYWFDNPASTDRPYKIQVVPSSVTSGSATTLQVFEFWNSGRITDVTNKSTFSTPSNNIPSGFIGTVYARYNGMECSASFSDLTPQPAVIEPVPFVGTVAPLPTVQPIMQMIAIEPISAQTLSVSINANNIDLSIYMIGNDLFGDIAFNGTILAQCRKFVTGRPLFRVSQYGFAGDFWVIDTQGKNADPVYTGLGDRWQLVYYG